MPAIQIGNHIFNHNKWAEIQWVPGSPCDCGCRRRDMVDRCYPAYLIVTLTNGTSEQLYDVTQDDYFNMSWGPGGGDSDDEESDDC